MTTKNGKEGQSKRKNPSLLDEVLERRMLLYALAAGATLACGSSAQAKVVFTPNNSVLYTPGNLQIDMTHDGTIDFDLRGSCDSPTSCSLGTTMSARGYGRNGIEGSDGHAAALSEGDKIGPGAKFEQTGIMMNCSMDRCRGPFANTTLRALGVRFLISGKVHYGWIGFRKVGNFSATLVGWAYETVANTPILAGQGAKESDALSFAEPTSLRLLAAGHAAVAERRRRETWTLARQS